MNNLMPINLKTQMKFTNSFKKFTLLKLIQEETELPDVLLQPLKKVNIQKNFPSKKAPGPDDSPCEFNQTLQEQTNIGLK